MLLTYCAYMAVAVCLAGIVYRISRWLTLGVGPEAEAASIGDRLRGAGMFSSVQAGKMQRRISILPPDS